MIILFITAAINLNATDDTQIIAVADTSQYIEPMVNYKTKSSTGALLRSFAMPGWGQIYVESYWKAPIFFGGAAALAYLIVRNNSEFSDYQDQYNAIENKNSIEALTLRNKRENARDNRDMSAFYLLGVYALAAVDAYVGSHLFDFDVSDDYMIYLSNKHNGINFHFQYKIK